MTLKRVLTIFFNKYSEYVDVAIRRGQLWRKRRKCGKIEVTSTTKTGGSVRTLSCNVRSTRKRQIRRLLWTVHQVHLLVLLQLWLSRRNIKNTKLIRCFLNLAFRNNNNYNAYFTERFHNKHFKISPNSKGNGYNQISKNDQNIS